jgi:hypothetical protein
VRKWIRAQKETFRRGREGFFVVPRPKLEPRPKIGICKNVAFDHRARPRNEWSHVARPDARIRSYFFFFVVFLVVFLAAFFFAIASYLLS